MKFLNVTAVLLIAAGCNSGPTTDCMRPRAGIWNFDAGTDTTYRLSGFLYFGSDSTRIVAAGVSREGTGERMDYPLDDLRLGPDSLSFTFAPLGVRVAASCLTQDTLEMHFALPQPPFDSIRGVGLMTRNQ